MKKQKPPASRRTPAKAVAREFKSYDIPGDLPRLYALRGIRKVPVSWTRDTMEQRLTHLEACIEYNVVPGARGRCLGRTGGHTEWECVDIPDGLVAHMKDLRKASAMVRRYLASEDLEAAAERMDGIEELVRDMCDRVNRSAIEHGLEFSNKSTDKASEQRKRDGNTKKSKLVAKAQEELEKGNGRFKNGNVNISELARRCREVALHLSFGRVHHILGEARKNGKPAIRPTK